MIETTQLTIQSDHIPEDFDSFKIAQVSDLHNAMFGKDNQRLTKAIEKVEPDLIVVTGDVIDSRRTDVDVAYRFFEAVKNIAPVYYVTGNHEARLDLYPTFQSRIEDIGVQVLKNTSIELTKNNETITLTGVDDPLFQQDSTEEATMMNQLDRALPEASNYTILLSHRPEHFSLYEQAGVDLVFSGHAHGGQVRLPFIGGLIAPHQGWLPEYTSGKYVSSETTMIVSRGLGNSLFPIRVNNPPELIVVTLTNR
ncbi:hypothetical protein SAMN05421839_14216 [Halolactibacillus halophilus]|uniref:Phosphoesterase n=1 Tax=Halolactibacillus halophilus TaxID=306540 RepID=A0A1I5SCT6_9BACI|nr:metallophosphoesterase [Halolactibacillus halophilus]GEM02526.1 phosphoesterase [Halolactibacillus halophilus]SFP68529.1 hypothetical protein SAMN05421839_14216 [Halolactibacillus halophilus]